ncbi:DUF1361 domain-containing protein [Umezakia ovalisporum]|jgi:uncharacterized membrane protein|uniref:DUF1361 domain-containing protein n=2 Tax=Umezakia ovalisporum TaxID=75695 RepID=A0AA43GWD7_9CYAN|nr:DUF1361 domain-containing protein [Umezakia ovalisporum]MDH6057326.1 DUF1361 domain-containing protein [Umezakia ovalisporum FSS-43]MDH6062402.1 DUF1361 domain-containing protein [Umezakia ovalisporum FSS-62]MDH6069150.1 DUF1361 domain-containing protein [Umezakia ovalisporum APH033B]MDH6072748.1 DUF1361 domain-containing protein [Umezakia ovalisporum CobakiLakeA]MDH6075599.1 DUF1361 domain-containing protein [Umezakia ovalisporum CS-1034]
MKKELIATLIQILRFNMPWMTWNLFLAFIPLALSVWLFRIKRGRSWVWWLGFLIFFAFLPNAPYLLTDIIHFIEDIRRIQSVWMITLVLIPIYIIVILAGFEAYVISLINLGYYLHLIGKSQWTFAVELITHALCSVGIYWGRFLRFNSWDFVTKPDALLTKGIEDLLGRQPLIIIALTFVILLTLYWIMKRASLGFVMQPQNRISIRTQRVNSDIS